MAVSKFGARAPASFVVPCRISAKDIEAMDYWLNEAPMADPSRQNAICFALKRILKEDAELVLRDRAPGRVEVVVNGAIVLALPKELADWWRKVLVGHRATALTAAVEIPVDLLAPALRFSLLEQARMLAARNWPVEMAKASAA